MELKKIEFKSEILKTVTREKDCFKYVKKCKNHFARAKTGLLKSIPDIKKRLIFAVDFKSIEIDNKLISEISKAYEVASATDKPLIHKAVVSLTNCLQGKATNSVEW